MANQIKPYGYVKHMMLFEAAYFDERLQNATRLVLGLIIRHTQPDGISRHFSIYQTAKRKKVSRQATQNQVKKLIKLKYIEKHKSRQGHRTQYKLLFDNLAATPLDCPQAPATQSGCLEATPRDCPPATQSGCTKKMKDNNKNKKEKNARVREDFLDLVKEAIADHSFQELGNLSEEIIISQATACWETWSGNNEFPEGNPIDKFKGWIRTGIRNGAIKETFDMPKDRNARQGVQEESFENPIQDWHKQIEPIVGEDIVRSWLRECWHDGNGKLCAPSKFKANWIRERYSSEIAQVLPNVEIIYQPYKAKVHGKPL